MRQPISSDPATGTTKYQPEQTTREVLCYLWLLEYDLACARERTKELLAEVRDGLVQNDHIDRRHTAQVLAEARDDLVQYHRPGKRGGRQDFRERYTRRLLKEANQ